MQFFLPSLIYSNKLFGFTATSALVFGEYCSISWRPLWVRLSKLSIPFDDYTVIILIYKHNFIKESEQRLCVVLQKPTPTIVFHFQGRLLLGQMNFLSFFLLYAHAMARTYEITSVEFSGSKMIVFIRVHLVFKHFRSLTD